MRLLRVLCSLLVVVGSVLPATWAGSQPQPCGSTCYTVVTLDNGITVADAKSLEARIAPNLHIIPNAAGTVVTLVGSQGDVSNGATALAALINANKPPKPGPKVPAPPDDFCLIDDVSPDIASTMATDIASILAGNPYPAPSASPSAASGAGAQPPPAAAKFSATNGSVVIDSSQSRIFVYAPADAIGQLQMALPHFTNESSQAFATYDVRYAIANPIPAPSNSPVNGELSVTAPSTVATSTVQDLAQTVQGVINQQSQVDVRVSADPSYPRILVGGSRTAVNQALGLLRNLDRRPPEIELDAQYFRFENGANNQLGTSFPASIGATIGAYSIPAPGTASTPAPLFQGKIVTTAGPTIAAQINTLISNGQARVISEPKLVTLSGRQAEVDVGQVIPFATTSLTSTGAVNAGVVNYVIGTHLEMIPMANYDGTITVYVHPINSQLTGITAQNAPQFARQEASATYRLSPGDAILITGLMETDDSDNRGAPPILNLIPFFGKHLLGSHTYSRTQSHVAIQIKATLQNAGDFAFQSPQPGQSPDDPASPLPETIPLVPLKWSCASPAPASLGPAPGVADENSAQPLTSKALSAALRDALSAAQQRLVAAQKQYSDLQARYKQAESDATQRAHNALLLQVKAAAVRNLTQEFSASPTGGKHAGPAAATVPFLATLRPALQKTDAAAKTAAASAKAASAKSTILKTQLDAQAQTTAALQREAAALVCAVEPGKCTRASSSTAPPRPTSSPTPIPITPPQPLATIQPFGVR